MRGVAKRFGTVAALQGVDLEISPGEFVVFLGPSGCGKTTLLRIVAGFERADQGSVILDGKELRSTPPHLRDVGMVFQSLALFPHLTVEKNISFGLELRDRPQEEIGRSVREVLELVDLNGFEKRHIMQLSGGQRQRVALARALVLHPTLLLLDEPLSALDMKLRRQLQQELKALQRRTGTTFVFVTHDQEEALSMADHVGVFNQGRLEQFGTPRELYQKPATRFVAEFVGDANIRTAAELAPFGVQIPEGVLVIRPEDCLVGDAAASAPARSEARIRDLEFIGPHVRLTLDLDGFAQPWLALCPGASIGQLSVGARTTLGFDPARTARTETPAP